MVYCLDSSDPITISWATLIKQKAFTFRETLVDLCMHVGILLFRHYWHYYQDRHIEEGVILSRSQAFCVLGAATHDKVSSSSQKAHAWPQMKKRI